MTPLIRLFTQVFRASPQRLEELGCHIRRDIGLACPAEPQPLSMRGLRLR